MSKLYLTANSDAIKTFRTARGHHWVKCSLQSWEGSIGVSLDEHGNVEIWVGSGSTSDPRERLIGSATIQDLLRLGGAIL